MSGYDAVVVGAGPNGLAAAVTLARAGVSVLVREAAPTIGGGTRTESLTLPGFLHDVCSASHPLGAGSPFFAGLDLHERGLEWVHARLPLAHPLDGDDAAWLDRDVGQTADGLNPDGAAWRRLVEPFVESWDRLVEDVLRPVRLPRHPFLMARFGRIALRSASGLARNRFRGLRARALLAGLAAHSNMPLDRAASAAAGLVLGVAGHVVGWPVARRGSQSITEALASLLRARGGRIELGAPVDTLDELPRSRAVLLDVAPREAVRLAGPRLPAGYARALGRYRHAPGAFKVDWALSSPIPWNSAACRNASVVHVGGLLEEIEASERDVAAGRPPEKPFVLLGQPSICDDTRAPAGMHTAWGYCHVPAGSTFDMTSCIEAQIERFAPGFHDVILERSVMPPAALESHDRNLVGGDVTGGANDFWQTLFRPVLRWDPYRMPARGLYLCSASTPPGAGVHGMCGFNAARRVLRDLGV